jgi:ABC-type nitrate/sulfonate/bicarbonate transport system substrate-binding protein
MTNHRQGRRSGWRSCVLAGAIVLGAAAVTACGSSSSGSSGAAGSLTTVTVGLGGNIFDLPMLVAEQDGFFKKEGLDAKFTVLTSGTGNTALASGSVDFLNQSPTDMLEALQKGLQQEAIESGASGVPLGLVVSTSFAKQHGITSATPAATVAKDMAGSTGGESSPTTEGETKMFLKAYGVSPAQVKLVQLTSPSADEAALTSNEISWFLTSEPIPLELQAEGHGVVAATPQTAPVWSPTKTGYGIVVSIMKSYGDSNPAIVKKFVAALAAATAYVRTHESDVMGIAATIVPGVSKQLLLKSYSEVTWPATGDLSAAQLQQTVNFIQAEGADPGLPSTWDPSAWTNKYVSS